MITTTLHDHRIITFADFPAVVFSAPYTEGYEIDRVQVTLDWFGPNEYNEAVGWDVDVRVQGWPLTKQGLRNKRIKQRESVYKADRDSWPPICHEAVLEAYALAIQKGSVIPEDVIGDDGNAGSVKTLL